MSSGQTVALWTPLQVRLAHSLIDKAPKGAVVNIREAARTSEQNNKMWAMLSDVSRAKPQGRAHTTEQWKAIFMAACDHAPSFVPDLDGGGFICTGYRSSRLTKAQMSEMIECIYAYGVQNGIEWSDVRETPTP